MRDKSLLMVVAGLTLAVVLSLTLVCVSVHKSQKYDRAITCMNEGNYDEAVQLFDELGGYKESRERRKECIELRDQYAGFEPSEEDVDLYTIRIEDKDFPIYHGAGYDKGFAGTVEKAAAYTIVEEVIGSDGELWGRLKSGRGWVNIEAARNSTPSTEDAVRVKYGGVDIFKQPSRQSEYVGIIRNPATYTLVEKTVGADGELWGKLKSGLGWINLEQAETIEYQPVLVDFVNEKVFKETNYMRISLDNGYSHKKQLVFYASEPLRNVTLKTYSGVRTVDVLTPERPLVVDMSFGEDMERINLFFEDASGRDRAFEICYYITGTNFGKEGDPLEVKEQ